MRIVLNTRSDNNTTRLGIYGLRDRLIAMGIEAVANDWDNYDKYDVALYMGYDYDIENARRQNPNIRITLMDPKPSRKEWIQAARDADFLMVSSVEQREIFYPLNRNIMIWYMLPIMPPVEKLHVDKEPIIIGYHGNKLHLNCMFETITPALNELAHHHKIELWAIYNVEKFGKLADKYMPDESLLKVRHIQWLDDYAPNSSVTSQFYNELAQADIGIVPNALPIKTPLDALEQVAYPNFEFGLRPFDHLLRYKSSCNPGRIYPFAQLGIPVVADFAPSSCQFIFDGEEGFVVSTSYGWFEALHTLAESAELRNRMAKKLQEKMAREYDTQVQTFLDFCQNPLIKSAPHYFKHITTTEEQLSRMPRYLSHQKKKPRWGVKTIRRVKRLVVLHRE